MAGPINLTPVNDRIVTSQAPQSQVSPSQIASPYRDLAAALDKQGEAMGKVGGALETVAETSAKYAGLNAVTRDDQGNIQVQKMPILGPASEDYAHGIKFAALADGEGAAKTADIALRQQHRDDPQGYLAAADAFKKEKVKQYTDAAGPEVGLTLGKIIDSTTTQTYRGLLNEKERLDLQRADSSITSQIQSARDDLVALARGGDTASDTFRQTVDKIHTLTAERVNNPRLAYPQAAADYDMAKLDGDLRANGVLYHVDQVYKDKATNDDGTARGGYQPALDEAKKILTDPSLKLSEQQRNAYYSKAVGEIHANEAIRRQNIGEARAAAQSLSMRSAYGAKVEPEEVEQVAQAYRAAGAPGEAARLYATYARKPLNDDFGRQPLSVQTQQLQQLRATASVRNNNPGAQYPGPVATQFGATRSENLTDGNQIASFPTPVHGAAAQFALLDKSYVGQPLSAAIGKWSGHNNAAAYVASIAKETGLTPDTVITPELLRGPQGIALAKAMAKVETGRPFPMADAQWQQAQAAAFAGQPLPAAPAVAANPASSAWLAANHARTLATEAGNSWIRVMKDYDEKGLRPADGVINQIVDAARATNNQGLLETIGAGVERMDLAQQQGERPLPQQQANITQLQSAASAGQLSPGQAGVLKDLERKYSAITKGLDENPIQTTVANFPTRFKTPAPLDLTNPENLTAGLAMRGEIAQFAKQTWQSGAVSALDKSDLAQVQAALDTPDPKVKGQIFAAITAALPEDVRNATLAKLGEKRPDFMVSAAAGGLMRDAPEVAQSILRGQAAIKADKGYWPNGPGEVAAVATEMDKQLPAATFSLAGRTDDRGPFAVAQGMVKARYADLSAQAGDAGGKFNSARLEQSVEDVTGGILHHNGTPLIAPQRGMSQLDFDKMMNGVTDNDLAGATTLNGQPVNADYLRGSAQLESLADGRYLVRLGKDPLKPVYAYSYAGTEAPQKFVLDLRGKQPPNGRLSATDLRNPAYATGP